MRRLFVVLLLVLAAAASFAYLVRLDAGYVLIELHGYTVETTAWVAALLVLLGLIAFYYLGRALVLLADLLSRLFSGRPRRHGGFLERLHARRRSHTVRGVLAFAEGRWRAAVKQLARGARHADAPLLNHLLAARASAELGDRELAEGFLQLAREVPGAQQAVALAQAEAALARGENREALAILDGAALDPAAQPAGIALQLGALERLGEWARIGALLPQARRQKVRPEAMLDAIEDRAYRELLSLEGMKPEALRTAWEAMPTGARQRPALICAYASALARAGASDEAAAQLGVALKRGWDPELVRAYGLVPAADPRRQLALAESLLAGHANEPELLLALGRIALRNQLWGKARDYLESSLKLAARPDTCAELARLCEHLGETEHSRALLLRAVRGSVGELPALPMPGR